MRNPRSLIAILFLLLIIFVASCTNGKKHEPADITTGDILKDSRIFRDLYSMHSQDLVSIEGNNLKISLYNLKSEELVFYDNIPKSIVVIDAKRNGSIKIPLLSLRPLDKIPYFIPKTRKSMVCIQDGAGGNAWNANPIQIILFSQDHFLKNAGDVSDVRDVDSDGKDELITYDDIWENGLGFLCHADSPGAKIFWRIMNGILVRDAETNMKYCHEEIKRIAKEIRDFPAEIPNGNSERLLSLILQQFLMYRLIGKIDQGWDKFKQNIKRYDNQFFYLYQGQLQKIPIAEIEDRIRESIEEER